MTDADRRIAALQQYDIMDTEPEQSFDDLVLLTSVICDTPIAMISLLDAHRQWFKARVGITYSESAIEHAFCAHAIQQERVFLVPDATQDDRFRENPGVTGNPHIRSYAGAPLLSHDGVPLGTLCAIDQQPRQFTPAQLGALSALARQVERLLDLRRTVKALQQTLTEVAAANQEIATLRDILPMCSWCRKVRDDDDYWSNVDDYLATHSHIRFSHGICPVCAEQVRSQFDRKHGAQTSAK